MLENILYFLKGFIVGATIAAIGGPVALLCIQQSLRSGPQAGVAIGAGAALADALFGAIGAFSITLISIFLLSYQTQMRLIGSVVLLYLGMITVLEKPKSNGISAHSVSTFHDLVKYFLTAFFITLTNPATIIFFMAISIGLKIQSYSGSSLFVTGIFIGSLVWFSLLSLFVVYFKSRITTHKLKYLNFGLGFFLILFGLYIAITTIY